MKGGGGAGAHAPLGRGLADEGEDSGGDEEEGGGSLLHLCANLVLFNIINRVNRLPSYIINDYSGNP